MRNHFCYPFLNRKRMRCDTENVKKGEEQVWVKYLEKTVMEYKR